MRRRSIWVFAVALLLSGCVQWWFPHPGGERTELNVEVEFVDESNSIQPNKTVYLVERVGTNHVVTELLTTDSRGRVRITGPHCLPMQVAMRGGAANIRTVDLAPFYRVALDKERFFANLEEAYGRPDSRFLAYGRRHDDCG